MDHKKQELTNHFFRSKFYGLPCGGCIDWAMSELEQGATDEDVQILAGLDATDYWEIKRYIEKIVGMELVESDYAHQNWAGKLIVELAEDYNSGAIGVVELDTIISKLYYKLGYPGSMTMLARNSEYATDVPRHLPTVFKMN